MTTREARERGKGEPTTFVRLAKDVIRSRFLRFLFALAVVVAGGFGWYNLLREREEERHIPTLREQVYAGIAADSEGRILATEENREKHLAKIEVEFRGRNTYLCGLTPGAKTIRNRTQRTSIGDKYCVPGIPSYVVFSAAIFVRGHEPFSFRLCGTSFRFASPALWPGGTAAGPRDEQADEGPLESLAERGMCARTWQDG